MDLPMPSLPHGGPCRRPGIPLPRVSEPPQRPLPPLPGKFAECRDRLVREAAGGAMDLPMPSLPHGGPCRRPGIPPPKVPEPLQWALPLLLEKFAEYRDQLVREAADLVFARGPVLSVSGRTGDVVLDATDVGLGNVVDTGDSGVPVPGGLTKFTTGGAFTELAKKVSRSELFDNPDTAPKVKPSLLPDVGGKFIVAQTLPDLATADPKAIYLVPRTAGETGNIYDEYLRVEPTGGTYAWEKIGSTDIDLSGYVQKTQKINGKALSGDVTLTPSDVGAATAAQGAKADAAPSRAEVEAGWWSEWAVVVPEDETETVAVVWTDYFGDWEWCFDHPIGGYLRTGNTDEDASRIAFGGYIATRYRVAAPVPRQPEDIGAATAAQGAKADAALSRAEAEAGFTEWTITPPTYEGSALHVSVNSGGEFPAWYLRKEDDEAIGECVASEDATSLNFSPYVNVTATRTRLPTMADIPTKTSDLVNDSGFATASQIPQVPTSVSAFENDAGYVTEDELLEAVNGARDDAASMDDAKADKRIPAATGNLASLTTDGNLMDSGKRPSDFAPSSDIPKSALAADVQASLGLADSALQVPQELVYEDGAWTTASLGDGVELVDGPRYDAEHYPDFPWSANFSIYGTSSTLQLSAPEDATELKFGPNGAIAVFSRVPAGYVLREATRSKSRSVVPDPGDRVQPAGFYADRSEMSVTAGTGADADKATIQLKDGLSATVLTQHQDISGKADASDVADLETAVAAKADKDYVDGLFNYKAITASLSITASSPSLGSGESQTVRENGRKVTAATFHYVFNKVPVEAKFGTADPPTEAVDNPALSGDIAKTGMLVTSATTWRISGKEAATPGKTQQTATASVTISFYNGVYYGVAAIPGTLDSAFILGLANKSLRSGKLTSFTVNAGAGQHIWYALPESMGACTFKVGGFDGGFTLADTIQFTNSVGHAESYRVYRSDNPSLGSTTVNVS